jgi:hypothetical protein
MIEAVGSFYGIERNVGRPAASLRPIDNASAEPFPTERNLGGISRDPLGSSNSTRNACICCNMRAGHQIETCRRQECSFACSRSIKNQGALIQKRKDSHALLRVKRPNPKPRADDASQGITLRPSKRSSHYPGGPGSSPPCNFARARAALSSNFHVRTIPFARSSGDPQSGL